MKAIRLLVIILLISIPVCSYAQFGSSMYNSIMKYERAKAEGKNVKSWQRYEAGYSLPIANATYTHQVSTTDDFGNVYDTIRSAKIKATSTFGVYAGTFFPISNFNEDAMLAISVGVRMNLYKFSTGNLVIDSAVTDNYDFLTMEMGVPVSLDYKWGCDARLDKTKHSSLTAGFGFYPVYMFTGIPTGINADGSVNVAGGGKFGLQPFLKAEVGFFAGICFKVRAMYNFGTINYLNMGADDGTSEKISLVGKSNLTLSLIIMPFSWDWDRAKW